MKKVWNKWQAITKKIVNMQANIVLFIIYFLLIIPLGLILKTFFPKVLFGHRHQARKGSFWIPYKKTTYDISFAKKQ